MEKIEFIEYNGEKYPFRKPIEYKAERIAERSDKSVFKDAIHWIVTINGQSWEYSVGVGHYYNAPYYDKQTWDGKQAQKQILDTIYSSNSFVSFAGGISGDSIKKAVSYINKKCVSFELSLSSIKKLKLLPPSLIDVLYSLALDSSALDDCFSDWCANFGYDDDSRKAKAAYDACVESSHKLRKAGIDWRELSEFLQDF